MIYALDTEFIDDGSTIELISIGIVAEDGREYYRQNLDCQFGRANQWVIDNVYPHLHDFDWIASRKGKKPYLITVSDVWKSPATLRQEIVQFVGNRPVFYGYYAAYDWVVLCQLFGAMVNLPQSWPMYCRDMRQWLDENGLRTVKQPEDMPHHALSDARWIMQARMTYPRQVLSGLSIPQYVNI